MTQADSVLSTPPTNTPVDTTRRRFLAVAAVASAVSAGTLAAATAMDPSVPAAVTISRHSTPDPVFGLIEAHRKAGRDHEAALVEQNRLERIGDKAADWVAEAPCRAARPPSAGRLQPIALSCWRSSTSRLRGARTGR
jgi:hypothetical protein